VIPRLLLRNKNIAVGQGIRGNRDPELKFCAKLESILASAK